MAKSDDTFDLIKTLSKSEKRFFRLFTSTTEGSKNYLKLFDVLDKLETYDSKKIAAKLESLRLNLSHEKNYLRKMILKSLRHYHSGNSPLAEITSSLQEAEILYRKGLLDQALPLLGRVRELAEAYEYFTLHLEALNFELKIFQRHRSEESMKKILNNVRVIDEQMNLLQNRIDFDRVHVKISELNNRYGLYQPEKSLEELRKLCHEGLFADKKNALSDSALKVYYASMVTYYWHKEDYPAAITVIESNVNMQEAHPELIEKEPHGYLAALYNLALIFLRQKNDEKFFLYLRKINELAEADYLKTNEPFRVSVLERAVNFEAHYFLENAKFKEGKAIIETLKNKIAPYSQLMSKDFIATLRLGFARLCYGAGDYREAIRHLQETLNHPKTELGQDTLIYSKILLLVIHYDMGNQDMLGYLTGLFKKTVLKEEEAAFIHFFKKSLAKTTSRSETIAAMKKFREQTMHFQPSDYLNIDLWLRSKIEGREYGDLVAELVAEERKEK